MFRIQDKGSRLVVELKETYNKKMLNYLEDVSIFQENHEDQCQVNEKKVNDWVRKWENQEQLGGEEAEWILSSKTKPAKVYANIKTHKEGWPYRYIISCNQTAIEKLAHWVEYQLKSLSRQHPTYLKDTKHFLSFLEKLNEEQGPFKMNEITMVCRDVSNFYPSCDTKKCLDAVKKLLLTRKYNYPSTECILEAIGITMTSNSTKFSNRFFTQIDGATIGSPDSGSITDIFGAVFIDKKFMEECPRKPDNYKRYRDDTIDVCKNTTEKEQQEITGWMNSNIYQNKIKFNIESIGEEVIFLDTKVKVVEVQKEGEQRFILAPSMYSKDTDTHQYLSPESCHPIHIMKNIPTTVANRCRTNCSDKVEDDNIFKETLVEYKAYLLKSGYNEQNINEKFINLAVKKKRSHILKDNGKKKQQKTFQKYRFVTEYEPSFPDIRKAFWKFDHILKNDEKMKKVFPYGVKHFQISEKRGTKNIKEILAPSTVNLNDCEYVDNETAEQDLGCHPCNKPCVYCQLLSKTEANHFKSVQTGQSFKIRQSINCQSKDIIYLVSCVKCNLQGVGSTTQFNKRISNYFSHIKQRKRTCGIVEHFIDHHREEWKESYKENNLFQIIGISKLTNKPTNGKLTSKRLEEFEGYWQMRLVTVHPYGLNKINELKECHQRFGTKF